MVAYSFQKQFVAPIQAGTKRQTIRAERKGRSRHARAGETLQLYTAMRTKYCQSIGTAVCEGSAPIKLNFYDNIIQVGGKAIEGWLGLDDFARSDGFDGWLSMSDFWRSTHGPLFVFNGVLIRWADFVPAENVR